MTLPVKRLDTAPNRSDAALVEVALLGGPAAFGPIIERYKDAVFGIALSRLRNFHDAEDLAQSTFIEAFERLHNLKDPNRLGAWLRSITIHRCINYLKRASRCVDFDAIDEPASEGCDPHTELERAELRDRVMAAIGRLSKTQRETVALYYISGYSLQEIVQIQEVPIGTLKRRLHDARNRLKEDMLHMVEDVLKEGAPGADFAEQVFHLLNAYPNRKNLWKRDILSKLEKIGAAGISGYQKALQQPHWQTRRAAVLYLDLPPATEEVIDMLKQALDDTNKKVRRHAMDALLDLEVGDVRKRDEFMPLIVEKMFDPSKQVRNFFTSVWPLGSHVADIPPRKNRRSHRPGIRSQAQNAMAPTPCGCSPHAHAQNQLNQAAGPGRCAVASSTKKAGCFRDA